MTTAKNTIGGLPPVKCECGARCDLSYHDNRWWCSACLWVEIERLRKKRRDECTQFAKIAKVNDSRDTRIVLADAEEKFKQLLEDQDKLVEHFRNVDVSEGQRGDLDNATTAESAIRVMVERKAEIKRLRGQDDVHWKTRRSLLAEIERLQALLRRRKKE